MLKSVALGHSLVKEIGGQSIVLFAVYGLKLAPFREETGTSGAEAHYFSILVARLKRLRKKPDRARKHAPGAKAQVDYIAFAPGINPRPTLKPSFSATCEVAP